MINKEKQPDNAYDDDDIPEIDLPQNLEWFPPLDSEGFEKTEE